MSNYNYKVKQLMKWQSEELRADIEQLYGKNFTTDQVIDHLAHRIARLESVVDILQDENNRRHSFALQSVLRAHDRIDLTAHAIDNIKGLINNIHRWLNGIRM